MDTPGPDVVKDSQQSHPNVTPKSATFGSPLHTQESWTAPPRRRPVQQKAKASFIDEEDERSDSHVTPNPREQLDGDLHLDSTSSGIDPGQDGDDNEVRDVFNQSPTLHGLLGAHIPPQSAQPAPERSMSGSSDPFSNFESLKKQPPTAVTSRNPPKIAHSQKPLQPVQTQKRTLETRGTTDTEGKMRPSTKDTELEPKALANSKVKLSGLELEEETGAERPDIHKSHEYDYSLPASNSSSPVAAPAKKRAPAKKQAVKKPAPKPKANARETKATAGGRPRNAKPAPVPPAHQSPEAHSDEEHDEDKLPTEEPSVVTQAPHEANHNSQMKGQKLESGNSSNEDEKQDVIIVSSDSTSSFPESDNTDDQDFECSRKMTPSNARRRTRATAARSQAAKQVKGKDKNHSNPRPNAQSHDAQDERNDVDTAKRAKRQPKQPPKKTAVEKTQAVAIGTEPNLESKKEFKSSGEKSKKKSSTSERTAAVNQTANAKGEIKQETVVSSNADRVGRGEAYKVGQTSEPAKQTKESRRKPNIVAFGLGGPKNNGRPHKTTATADSRSQVQQPGPINGEYPVATKNQQAKGSQKAPKMQLNTAVQGGDSPTNDFNGLVKGGLSRTARASQPTVAEAVPDNAPISKAETKEIVSDFDAEMTTLVDEAGRGDASGQSANGDFEADTAVDDAANLTVDSPKHQSHEVARRRASEVDERAQAWKKATEPYDNSLGETMHKIVNTILRGLKTSEAAIDDVVDDYQKDGQRVVEKIAHKHRKERALITQQQEQKRLEYVQTYGQARHVAGTLLGKLESVDVDETVAHVRENAPTNHLKQLLQTITEA
ncbi:hypothetical protein INS49_007713 [Diaporthe citri]|uniref:uncharacterized protein n=1 Tax=Diaporthe citri TaxID=83186 RepID=UPI001C7EF916|nr:uncharacterized protein INS49_007713 [Diaporthe citri]KAG6362621.1 hypothetical protein INS49_007713 [Diaporthe citri]